MRCLCCIVTLQFIARGSRAAPILRRADVRNVLVADAVRCEGQALALRVSGRAFFVVRGPVPRATGIGAFFFVALRGTGPRATVKEARRPGRRRARACPPPAFGCLKQDLQDLQDLQDGAAWEDGPKVWKTFMSIETAGTTMLRSDRTLICATRFCCLNQDGQDAQDEQDASSYRRDGRPQKAAPGPRGPECL